MDDLNLNVDNYCKDRALILCNIDLCVSKSLEHMIPPDLYHEPIGIIISVCYIPVIINNCPIFQYHKGN